MMFYRVVSIFAGALITVGILGTPISQLNYIIIYVVTAAMIEDKIGSSQLVPPASPNSMTKNKHKNAIEQSSMQPNVEKEEKHGEDKTETQNVNAEHDMAKIKHEEKKLIPPIFHSRPSMLSSEYSAHSYRGFINLGLHKCDD